MRKIAMLLAVTAALLALGASAVFAQGEEASGGSGDYVNAELVDAEDTSGDPAEDFTAQARAHRNNQVVQCHGIPCVASGRNDMVYERVGNRKNDRILLKGGSDQVRADHYRNDKDVIRGSKGFDLIYVSDGDKRDRIFGGRGNDKCYVDVKREAVRGCSVIIRVRNR